MFDKSLVTIPMKNDTRARYVSWAIFEIVWAQESTEKPQKRSPLQELE
jgi:hypothetical protein